MRTPAIQGKRRITKSKQGVTNNQHLHMWKISEEQRTNLSDSYNHLQVEALVNIERQRDVLMKESDERAAQLTKRYEQALELVTAKAQSAQSTCEHIVR